jgi:hypothetical protein
LGFRDIRALKEWGSTMTGNPKELSELIDIKRWKRGSDCRSGVLFRNLFNSASECPSTPSEADDHHDESAGGSALQ